MTPKSGPKDIKFCLHFALTFDLISHDWSTTTKHYIECTNIDKFTSKFGRVGHTEYAAFKQLQCLNHYIYFWYKLFLPEISVWLPDISQPQMTPHCNISPTKKQME